METFVLIFGTFVLLSVITLALQQVLKVGFMVYTISRLNQEVQREQYNLISKMLGEL